MYTTSLGYPQGIKSLPHIVASTRLERQERDPQHKEKKSMDSKFRLGQPACSLLTLRRRNLQGSFVARNGKIPSSWSYSKDIAAGVCNREGCNPSVALVGVSTQCLYCWVDTDGLLQERLLSVDQLPKQQGGFSVSVCVSCFLFAACVNVPLI